MQENVTEVKTGCICIPEEVIHHVGKILDRPVMPAVGVEKEVVAERFESEEGAFYEWIVTGEEDVIPYWRPLDCRQSDEETNGRKKQITRPLFPKKGNEAPAKSYRRQWISRNLFHEQGCEREAASLNKRASSRSHGRTPEV